MELYFAPLSCSLATRIALYEGDIPVRFHQVELATKRTTDSRDYFAINPKGQVPALITDDGSILTEGPAVLQFVADLKPESALAPPAGTAARYEPQKWLNYIATEIHKGVYYLIFNPAVPAEAKTFARESVAGKYDFLSTHLAHRDYLLDGFTVADAYLGTTLGWAQPGGVDLARWPVLIRYLTKLRERPAVARAMQDELKLAGRA